ncbi:hypothetical protein JOM56_014496 [Amanita muscaria]
MDTVHESITEVAELIMNPLEKAIFGVDFRRGATDVNGMSFFTGEDFGKPVQFDVFGEVKSVGSNEYGPLWTLGRSASCGARTSMYWRQQVSVLEKIELEDMDVDQGLHTLVTRKTYGKQGIMA